MFSQRKLWKRPHDREIRNNPPEKKPDKPGKSIGTRLLKWMVVFLVILILLAAAGAGALYYGYRYYSRDLPKVHTLKDYRPPVITTVYAKDNSVIAEFCRERRIVIPYENIPVMLIHAFLAAEDARFFEHQGVDIKSIVRAAIKNIEAQTIVQGASTITMQVTRSFLLTPERSYRRKIREAILAYRIEQSLTKEEILYRYLNHIYLGSGAYGVAAAAETYFGKKTDELNLAECALLAGLPQAPSEYSPIRNPEKAYKRMQYTLTRMVDVGFITKEQADKARNYRYKPHEHENPFYEKTPYYTEHVRRYLESKYGEDVLYNEGLAVYTCVDPVLQEKARNAIEKGLLELDKRQGYRGPVKHLENDEEINAAILELKKNRKTLFRMQW